MSKRLTARVLFVLCLSFIVTQPLLGEWPSVVIDSEGDVGHLNRLVIDSNDRLHIVYVQTAQIYQHNMKYATDASGTWESELISAGTAVIGNGRAAIAVDSNNKPYLTCRTYGDWFTRSELYHHKNTDGTWSSETVPSTYSRPEGQTLFIDAHDTIYVGYHSSPNDDNFIAYKPTRGAWIEELVQSSGNTGGPSLYMFDSTTGYAAYSASNISLNFGEKTNNAWNYYQLASRGYAPELDLDGDGNPAVVFTSPDDGTIYYMNREGGSWDKEAVGQGPVYGSATLGHDSQGIPHISYVNASQDAVMHAWRMNGAWESEEVAQGLLFGIHSDELTFDFRWSHSLAIDSHDRVFIAYYDGNTGNLCLASQDLDLDEDGLPDSWEDSYGLDPSDPTGDNGPDGDPDRDGRTNLEEWQQRSNPRSIEMTLQIQCIDLVWTCVDGVQYQVYRTDSLEHPEWEPVGAPIEAHSGELRLSQIVSDSDLRYFRVEAVE